MQAGKEGQADEENASPLLEDGNYWMGLTLQGIGIVILRDGRVRARRQLGHEACEAISKKKLKDGWNHLVLTYDLHKLRIYLDGEACGEGQNDTPGYVRSHSFPILGFSRVLASKHPELNAKFTGELDQIKIIGTALQPEAVAELYKKGQWMSR